MRRIGKHSFFSVFLCTLLLLGLFTGLSFALGERFPSLQSSLSPLTKPLHNLSDTVKMNVTHLYGEAFRYDALLSENKALKEELSQLKAKERLREAISRENETLRSLLSFQQTRQELHLLAGKLISYGRDNFHHAITIAQGEKAGVSKGNIVIDEAGNLLGIVEEVGENACLATLLTDPSFTMGGEGENGEGGILKGSVSLMNEGLLTLTLLPPDSTLKVGDFVETFTSETNYPTGISVGTVVSITQDPRAFSTTAIIRPEGEIAQLSQVFIVTDFSPIFSDTEDAW